MDDLISRADAIDEVTLEIADMFDMTTYDAREVVAHALNRLPSADAVHGEWVDWLGNGNEWECSVCKCSIESHGSIAYNYCPMCGAIMKGGAE